MVYRPNIDNQRCFVLLPLRSPMLRGISKFLLVGLVAGCLISPAAGEDPHGSLVQRTVSISAEHSSLTDYLIGLLKSARIPGGVAIVNDQCVEAPENFPGFESNVQGALEKLVSSGHNLRWFEVGGSLVIYKGSSPPSVLEVTVREFHFSRKEPLTKASSTLFDSPEVGDRVRELHLVEYGPEMGFAQLPQPSTPEDTVTMTSTTVLDALNKIAGGHAVWLYNESRCERNLMSLNWPIR